MIAWRLQSAINIYKSDIEELVTEPEGQMLKKWRHKIGLQPIHPPVTSVRQVLSCRLPTSGKFIRGLVHFDMIHGWNDITSAQRS